ncbi:YacL family protein [Colwellia sp. MSW7]|uniref:YacL family protein n=1 Tax=Colwellia maritima TaxID=2912588 RepID=A0ABS9WZL1_9GAMM|nr:YacL family protein [Colwellia maritima]MCI2283245.1 YacL family protein [Colwellia maritima]
MEYEFIHDATTGEAKARFSLEHEVVGPWIEVELGHESAKLTALLTAIDSVEKRHESEVIITGHEYTVTISRDDVEIQTNASFNGTGPLSEMLTVDHIHYDESEYASCGIDDFRELLISWSRFTNIS